MDDADEALAIRGELERLAGRMLAIEATLGRLVWRVARSDARPAEWVETYAGALGRARDGWVAEPPLAAPAMAAAISALGEILHALEEGRLSLLPPPSRGPQPKTTARSFL